MRVLIVDDQQFVRDTLRSLFTEQQPHWDLSEASNGLEAVELFRKAAPDWPSDNSLRVRRPKWGANRFKRTIVIKLSWLSVQNGSKTFRSHQKANSLTG
jgi:hypothetical protein